MDNVIINRHAKRLGQCLVIIALSICMIIGLCGCNENDAKSAVSDTMTQLVNINSEDSTKAQQGLQTAIELYQAIGFYPQDYEVSYAAFSKNYFKDFSFKVTGAKTVKTNDNSTMVSVDVEANIASEKSIKALLKSVYQSFIAAGGAKTSGVVDISNTSASMSADGIFQDIFDASPLDRPATTISILMVKTQDNKWVPQSYESLASSLLGGLDEIQDAA